jgi:hypothetical protein
MYVYFITYSPILIKSLLAILNSPINSFCPLETILVLTPDAFHSMSLHLELMMKLQSEA